MWITQAELFSSLQWTTIVTKYTWKIEGRRRRGQQRMRWLNSITNTTDRSCLSKLWEIEKDRESWWAAVHRVTKSWTGLSRSTRTHYYPDTDQRKFGERPALREEPTVQKGETKHNWGLYYIPIRSVKSVSVLHLCLHSGPTPRQWMTYWSCPLILLTAPEKKENMVEYLCHRCKLISLSRNSARKT